MACRIWRDNRWRCTDPPTLLPTMRPARGCEFSVAVTCRYPTKLCEVTRMPLLVVRVKSEGDVKRALRGSTSIYPALLYLIIFSN